GRNGQSEASAEGLAVVDYQVVVPEQFGFMGGHGLVDGIFGHSFDLGSLADQQHAEALEPQSAGLSKKQVLSLPETKRISTDFQQRPRHSHRNENAVDRTNKGKHGQSQSNEYERTHDGGCKPERAGPSLLEKGLN